MRLITTAARKTDTIEPTENPEREPAGGHHMRGAPTALGAIASLTDGASRILPFSAPSMPRLGAERPIGRWGPAVRVLVRRVGMTGGLCSAFAPSSSPLSGDRGRLIRILAAPAVSWAQLVVSAPTYDWQWNIARRTHAPPRCSRTRSFNI